MRPSSALTVPPSSSTVKASCLGSESELREMACCSASSKMAGKMASSSGFTTSRLNCPLGVLPETGIVSVLLVWDGSAVWVGDAMGVSVVVSVGLAVAVSIATAVAVWVRDAAGVSVAMSVGLAVVVSTAVAVAVGVGDASTGVYPSGKVICNVKGPPSGSSPATLHATVTVVLPVTKTGSAVSWMSGAAGSGSWGWLYNLGLAGFLPNSRCASASSAASFSAGCGWV